MRDVITHRGPDDAGQLLSTTQAALAHRRLSIVDLAAGHQPLSNEDGSDLVVFNGEIYNHADDPAGARGARPPLPHPLRHRDHRPRLRAVGRRLRRALPRHVRVRDLGREAAAAAARARSAGHQAALLDAGRQTGCSSDPRSRRSSRAAWSQPRPTMRGLPELLSTRYLSGAETLFQGIHKLLPGHIARLRGRRGHDAAVLGRAGRRAPARASSGCRTPSAVAAVPRRCSRNRSACG